MKVIITAIILIISTTFQVKAAEVTTAQDDSLSVATTNRLSAAPGDSAPVRLKSADRIGDSRLFQATYLGAPLIIGGLIEKHQDKKFRTLRNDFMPMFKRPLDNYLQFVTGVVMVGLKAAGVKSRSSWGRMLVTDAIATSLMTSTVQLSKHTTDVTRPDGSDNHSFPSGHTATAFMIATMLSKEYGYLSPLVSVGSYAMATTTGLMRIANNKHWLSDVMAGAGIGIISTEMAYWIADAIFKDKGRNHLPTDDKKVQNLHGYDDGAGRSLVLLKVCRSRRSRHHVQPPLHY